VGARAASQGRSAGGAHAVSDRELASAMRAAGPATGRNQPAGATRAAGSGPQSVAPAGAHAQSQATESAPNDVEPTGGAHARDNAAGSGPSDVRPAGGAHARSEQEPAGAALATKDKPPAGGAHAASGDESGTALQSGPGGRHVATSADDVQDPQGTADPSGRKRRKRLPTARPPGAPPDPWTAFATTLERPPGRIRRATRAVGRTFIGEYALVIYGSLVLAVVLTWPTLRYPLHTVPQDVYDPSRQAWQIAWSGHILLTDPSRLWQSNAFFPEAYNFAFGDSLLGYAPAGMLGEGPLAAVLRYNILFVLAHALLVIGGYALVRQLGAGRTGATVAAVAFAYAPWRLAQEGHLDIVSAGGIPLALAMLARGHGWSMRYGFRPDRRHAGWATLGWLVAAWQIGLGFSLGLPFAYVLGGILIFLLIAVPIRWLRRKRPTLGARLLITDVLGALIVAGIGGLIAIPYLRSGGDGSARAEIAFFSPPLRSLLIGPAQSRIWGAPHAVPRSSLGWPAEMTLLPGFVLYALALVGLVFSIWTWWQRLLLVLALAAAVILTLGSTFFAGRWTYFPLFGHLPGSFGVRIPGRLMLWVTLLLAVLAAGAVAEVVRRAEQLAAQRMPPWPSPWMRLATLVPLLLVLVEGWNATAHPVVPAQPTAMRTVTSPTLVLPTSALSDPTSMLWSTSRFQPLANGAGGFAAVRQSQLRQNVVAFPDQASVQYLRSLGITTVLLFRSQVAGTPWERSGDVPVDTLGVQREDLDDNTVLFRLN